MKHIKLKPPTNELEADNNATAIADVCAECIHQEDYKLCEDCITQGNQYCFFEHYREDKK